MNFGANLLQMLVGPAAPKAKLAAAPPSSVVSDPTKLVVTITHEPFCPWFTLEYNNGQTEDLDWRQAVEWFRVRGAKNMEKIEQALDYAYNFGRGTDGIVSTLDGAYGFYEKRPGVVVTIDHPKPPPPPEGVSERYLPKL